LFCVLCRDRLIGGPEKLFFGTQFRYASSIAAASQRHRHQATPAEAYYVPYKKKTGREGFNLAYDPGHIMSASLYRLPAAPRPASCWCGAGGHAVDSDTRGILKVFLACRSASGDTFGRNAVSGALFDAVH
jgi:hypothetical protein